MLDEFLLELSTVKEHRSNGYDYHLLVHKVDLSERLEYLGYNVVSLDLFLGLLMHTEIGDGGYNIAKNLLFFLLVEQFK